MVTIIEMLWTMLLGVLLLAAIALTVFICELIWYLLILIARRR